MSEDHTPYDKMFNKEAETIEDLIPNPWEEDAEVSEVETVKEAPEPEVETIDAASMCEVDEEKVDAPERRVKVDIDAVAKLNLRATPDNKGSVIDRLLTGTMLKVLDDANSEWVFVQVDGVDQCGYVKKQYVVEA